MMQSINVMIADIDKFEGHVLATLKNARYKTVYSMSKETSA